MRNGLHVTKDKTKRVFAAIAGLPRREVLVGIPQEKAARQDDLTGAMKKAQDRVNNAMLGYIHNYGAPEQNIPQREFMEPGIKDVRAKINAYFAQAGKAALKGDGAAVDKALHAAGLTAQQGVRNRVQVGPFQPLSERTLAARRRKGRTGTKPLLDTAQMRNAITYVIRDRKVVK